MVSSQSAKYIYLNSQMTNAPGSTETKRSSSSRLVWTVTKRPSTHSADLDAVQSCV